MSTNNVNASIMLSILISEYNDKSFFNTITLALAKKHPKTFLNLYQEDLDNKFEDQQIDKHDTNACEFIESVWFMLYENKMNAVVIDYAAKYPKAFIESVKKCRDDVQIVNVEKCHDDVRKYYNVVMTDHNNENKIYAIKIVRELTGYGLIESKQAVESNNFKLFCYHWNNKEQMTFKEAKYFMTKFEDTWNMRPNAPKMPTLEIHKIK